MLYVIIRVSRVGRRVHTVGKAPLDQHGAQDYSTIRFGSGAWSAFLMRGLACMEKEPACTLSMPLRLYVGGTASYRHMQLW